MGTFAASMAVVSAAAAIKQGQIAKQAYANDAQASLENAEQVEMKAQQDEPLPMTLNGILLEVEV